MSLYNINSVPGTLGNVTFQIGDVLALKNFDVELVEGSRLKITSTQNANFCLLEADVSEVEIDGVVHTDPTTAQNALKALVFNPQQPQIINAQTLANLIQKTPNVTDRVILADGSLAEFYNKTDADDTFLSKPSQTASTTEAPFVVGVNADNESYKLPAGDLGKNIGNTDLIIPRGTVRTLDVTGAKLQLKGLESKASDRSFSRKLKTNERGEIAYSEEVDVVNNINVSLPNPMNIRIQANIPSWVQHQLSEPNISEDMRRVLQRIEEINNNSGFTLYNSDEILVNTLPVEKYPTSLQSGSYRLPSIIVANGLIRNDRPHNINAAFRSQEYINNLEAEGYSLFYNIVFNKELPTNKDWIVSWRTHFYTDLINQFLPDRGGNNKNLISSLGFRNNVRENIYQAQLSREDRLFHTISFFNAWLDTSGNASGGISVGSPLSQFYFIKTGNLLTLMKINQETGRVEISTVQYKDTYKYFSIESVISPHNVVVNDFMLKDISYWIEP